MLKTDPVSISGESKPFFRTVKVQLPPNIELLNPEDALVEVIVAVAEVERTVDIEDVSIEIKTFSKNIAVDYSPTTATVTVKAPGSVIKQLSKDSFYCEPIHSVEETGFKGKVAIEAKFRESVPSQIKENTVIVSSKPEAIDLTITTQSPETVE